MDMLPKLTITEDEYVIGDIKIPKAWVKEHEYIDKTTEIATLKLVIGVKKITP